MVDTTYSADAIEFIATNSPQIKAIATAIGVQPTALAAGIVREMTRGSVAAWRTALEAFPLSALIGAGSESIALAYDGTVGRRSANPTALSGRSYTQSFDPMMLDVGRIGVGVNLF